MVPYVVYMLFLTLQPIASAAPLTLGRFSHPAELYSSWPQCTWLMLRPLLADLPTHRRALLEYEDLYFVDQVLPKVQFAASLACFLFAAQCFHSRRACHRHPAPLQGCLWRYYSPGAE